MSPTNVVSCLWAEVPLHQARGGRGAGVSAYPLDLALCPVEVQALPQAAGSGHRAVARLAAPVSGFSLANVAIVADTGTGYQVQSATGARVCFAVDAAPRIAVGAAAAASDGTVVVDQGQDAEDFHQFMGHFMDTLDAIYPVPRAAAFAAVPSVGH